jgi:hypothetical protein
MLGAAVPPCVGLMIFVDVLQDHEDIETPITKPPVAFCNPLNAGILLDPRKKPLLADARRRRPSLRGAYDLRGRTASEDADTGFTTTGLEPKPMQKKLELGIMKTLKLR